MLLLKLVRWRNLCLNDLVTKVYHTSALSVLQCCPCLNVGHASVLSMPQYCPCLNVLSMSQCCPFLSVVHASLLSMSQCCLIVLKVTHTMSQVWMPMMVKYYISFSLQKCNLFSFRRSTKCPVSLITSESHQCSLTVVVGTHDGMLSTKRFQCSVLYLDQFNQMIVSRFSLII